MVRQRSTRAGARAKAPSAAGCVGERCWVSIVGVIDVPRHSPDTFVIDAARAQAYVSACGGTFVPTTDAASGRAWAPPVAVAIGTLVQGVQPILRQLLSTAQMGHVVHREEALTWHAPLCLDTPYRAIASLVHHEQRRAGGFVQVAVQVHDARGMTVVSSHSSLFVRPHGRPPAATLAPVAPSVAAAALAPALHQLQPWAVAADQPERYARASLETNPIHLDDAAARAAGLPGRILHGMCTLAYSARVLTEHASAQLGTAPAARSVRLSHLAARFVRPVFPGDTLTCRAGRNPDGSFHFDVVQQHGTVVLSRGIARIGGPA